MTIDEHVDKALMMERPYGCVDAAGTRIYDLKTLEITWNPQLLSAADRQGQKARLHDAGRGRYCRRTGLCTSAY